MKAGPGEGGGGANHKAEAQQQQSPPSASSSSGRLVADEDSSGHAPTSASAGPSPRRRRPLKTLLQNFLNHVSNLEAQKNEGENTYEKEFQVSLSSHQLEKENEILPKVLVFPQFHANS